MEKQKQISDLRKHLFDQMERLNDPTAELDKELKKANAFVAIGKVIVDSAVAEINYMKLNKGGGTGFIPASKQLTNGNAKKH